MSNITTTLAKRLRTRSLSLPITCAKHTVFSKPLNIDAIKQRAADWEPTLPPADLATNSNPNNDDDDALIAQMITYTAFDPGARHPLLLTSALPLPISFTSGTSTTSPLNPDTRQRSATASPAARTPSAPSSLNRAVEMQKASPAPSTGRCRPWPYSLPKALQPKAGTTFDLMYGDAGSERVGRVRVGLLQEVLYGVPEPGEGWGRGGA